MEKQNIFNKIKTVFLSFILKSSAKKKINKFAEIKRNILIKKLRSNAIAIVTNQIDFRSGCLKMENLKKSINEIYIIENIDLEIFKKYKNDISHLPIIEKTNYFKKEYIDSLDEQLNLINENYKKVIILKCQEIIEKIETNTF